jgi:hypothetical protein
LDGSKLNLISAALTVLFKNLVGFWVILFQLLFILGFVLLGLFFSVFVFLSDFQLGQKFPGITGDPN